MNSVKRQIIYTGYEWSNPKKTKHRKDTSKVTDTKLLKATIVLRGDTINDLSDFIGINRQNFSAKLNGKRDFKQTEIAKIIERYRLTDDETRAIFFGGLLKEGIRAWAWKNVRS